jgi:hypothetical protein
MGISLQTHIMSVSEIVNLYMKLRENLSVAEAASKTMAQCSISPSVLVDAFSAAQLAGSRTDQEAAIILKHRNELLSHFNRQNQPPAV